MARNREITGVKQGGEMWTKICVNRGCMDVKQG